MPQTLVKAQLKRLYSPDTLSLEEFQPSGPFGILITAMVGPANDRGEESFDIVLCTTDWFDLTMKEAIKSGRHHLFVKKNDYGVVREFLSQYCASCQGETWEIVGQKVARLGYWEFEDYRVHCA